jgi:hypothetical protein
VPTRNAPAVTAEDYAKASRTVIPQPKFELITRAYNTVIPVIFFPYSNISIDTRILVFGTNLKNNCVRFIHIKVIKSTTINITEFATEELLYTIQM